MKKLKIALVIALTGCTSLEKQQSNERAQVEIIKVQREALAREESSRTQAQIALYESLARVAEVDPSSADVAVVAMLMVGQGANESSSTGPLVQLREQKNETVETVKALAPTIGGIITNVGIAAINAQTQQDQIAATRDVQVNQANRTADAISSVASLGIVASNNAGDAITMTDQAWLNMGSYEDNDTTNTTTNVTTNTSTNTETNTSDSYNSSSETNTTTNTETNTTDSYNSTDNSVSGNTYDYSEAVTYGGEQMTLGSLLSFLQGTGRAYSLTLGDTVYTIDGDGEAIEIDCANQQPQFSPAPPLPAECEAGG